DRSGEGIGGGIAEDRDGWNRNLLMANLRSATVECHRGTAVVRCSRSPRFRKLPSGSDLTGEPDLAGANTLCQLCRVVQLLD
ncbi:MAG: hypothetical protein VYA92_01170, partial [Actinomycetota bacterium]|nr:hypothetical protein [Actinomycetota bacterium]